MTKILLVGYLSLGATASILIALIWEMYKTVIIIDSFVLMSASVILFFSAMNETDKHLQLQRIIKT
jgi:hypothetical protein